jgi:hypothetical protein
VILFPLHASPLSVLHVRTTQQGAVIDKATYALSQATGTRSTSCARRGGSITGLWVKSRMTLLLHLNVVVVILTYLILFGTYQRQENKVATIYFIFPCKALLFGDGNNSRLKKCTI